MCHEDSNEGVCMIGMSILWKNIFKFSVTTFTCIGLCTICELLDLECLIFEIVPLWVVSIWLFNQANLEKGLSKEFLQLKKRKDINVLFSENGWFNNVLTEK